MNKINLNTSVFGCMFAIVFIFTPRYSFAIDPTEIVNSVTSTESAKAEIQALMKAMDECGTGSCVHENAVAICEVVGATDVRIGGKIITPTHTYDGDLQISDQNLNFMRSVFRQCKPSNYQFWNGETVLRVAYNKIESTHRQGSSGSTILISTTNPTPVYIDTFSTRAGCLKGREVLIELGKKINPSQKNQLHCLNTE